MATILLIEDAPDLGLYEATLLEAAGHRLLRCSGKPTPYRPCPMMRGIPCVLADQADLLLFSCALYAPIRGTSYRGEHLLHAYRTHPIYERKPMLIVSVGRPEELPGTGPIEMVQKFDDPSAIITAVDRLLARGSDLRRSYEGTGPDDQQRGHRRAGHALQGDR